MDEYLRIRNAIKAKRPDLIDDFDAQGFRQRIPSAMSTWLQIHMPIKENWSWQLIAQTADIINHIEEHQ